MTLPLDIETPVTVTALGAVAGTHAGPADGETSAPVDVGSVGPAPHVIGVDETPLAGNSSLPASAHNLPRDCASAGQDQSGLGRADREDGNAQPALTVIAHGTPVGQGNIRSLGRGRPSIHQNAATLLPWRDTVRHATMTAIGRQSTFPLDCPVRTELTFTVPKPAGAPKTRRVWPSKRPDLDHMIRAALDAITHVAVTDDARVVELAAAKRYPLEGPDALTFPGVVIRIYTITEDPT